MPPPRSPRTRAGRRPTSWSTCWPDCTRSTTRRSASAGSAGRTGSLAGRVGGGKTRGEKWKRVEMRVVEEVAQRLERRPPAESRHAIVHGDYSFNNTMFRRDDPTRIQAVLDWEMS